jgi:uncharacterized protein YjeT (DUF2065 family)
MIKFVYLAIAITISFFGVMTNFFPEKIKRMMTVILNKDLFFIPGIFEIITGLIVLYFRYSTSIPFAITVVGVLIFVDGIFYLAGNKLLKETFEIILEMENRGMSYYSLVFYIIAAIIAYSIL